MLTRDAASLAAATEMYEANALVETGDEPLTRREAKQRPDWTGWRESEDVEWRRLWADFWPTSGDFRPTSDRLRATSEFYLSVTFRARIAL